MNHVLVIDDDHALVDLLRKFLALEGFAVDAAYDYDSGLAEALDHAILRRTRDIPNDDSEIKVGDIALSASRRVVVRAETPVELTAVEFNVLECLLRNAGSIVSRETLAERALGRPLAPFDRSVDVHVHNLRKKISATADERIKTIRGAGYMYAPPPQDVE